MVDFTGDQKKLNDDVLKIKNKKTRLLPERVKIVTQQKKVEVARFLHQ
jgi:hypothetical protein